jgi:hypothetical protein
VPAAGWDCAVGPLTWTVPERSRQVGVRYVLDVRRSRARICTPNSPAQRALLHYRYPVIASVCGGTHSRPRRAQQSRGILVAPSWQQRGHAGRDRIGLRRSR